MMEAAKAGPQHASILLSELPDKERGKPRMRFEISGRSAAQSASQLHTPSTLRSKSAAAVRNCSGEIVLARYVGRALMHVPRRVRAVSFGRLRSRSSGAAIFESSFWAKEEAYVSVEPDRAPPTGPPRMVTPVLTHLRPSGVVVSFTRSGSHPRVLTRFSSSPSALSLVCSSSNAALRWDLLPIIVPSSK